MPIYATGDRVSQSQYGHGTVTAVNEYHTVIDFDEHGPRTFKSSVVRLEPSSTVAPVKAAKARRKTVKKTVSV